MSSANLLSDKQPIDYTVDVHLYRDDDNSTLGKTRSNKRTPYRNISTSDGRYAFDSLPEDTYTIVFINDSVPVGDTTGIELNKGDSININIVVNNITIQIFNITNVEDNDITVNNFNIENGRIEASDSGFILTTAAFDTLVFKAEVVIGSKTGTVAVQLTYDENGAAQFTIIENDDGLPVNVAPLPPPPLSGKTPTNTATPTWHWSSQGGTGMYRYRLDNPNLSSDAIESSDTSFTRDSSLTEGPHTLYLQEQCSSGSWSTMAFFSITIDLTPPDAPQLKDSILTNDQQPNTILMLE
ncbi:MAG: hypothetical protein JW913_03700 [Chitinispirillaceae bacterium]|nr:hypothetical protein [Chitinispirillaceae bacterium]